MKTKLLIALLFALTFSGCKKNGDDSQDETADPVACFNIPSGVECGQFIQFTNCSSNGTSYSWDFGDHQSSSLSNPQHQYSYPEYAHYGPMDVTLTVTGNGKTNSITKTINLICPADKFVGTYSCVRTSTTLGNKNYKFSIYEFGVMGINISGLFNGDTSQCVPIRNAEGHMAFGTAVCSSFQVADGQYLCTSEYPACHQWWNLNGIATLSGNTLTMNNITFTDATALGSASIVGTK
jgi:hypothetical protein